VRRRPNKNNSKRIEVVDFQVLSSPHSSRIHQINRVMLQVLLALIPATVALIWFFGWGVLINLLIASVAALCAEAGVMWLRGRRALPVLSDCSALVTAWLFAMAIPPLLPWWMTVLGMFFAIVVVKQLYGGLGFNPFNPAMAAYVLLLISYPVEMTRWLSAAGGGGPLPDLAASLQLTFFGHLPQGLDWDALSGATPLDEMRTRLSMGWDVGQIGAGPQWGYLAGKGWEWVSLWLLLGGVWLVYRKVISWHIPLSLLGALLFMSLLFHLIDPASHSLGLFHLLSGGAMLGAFFIATDPVSACTTRKGQLIYGALIGVTVFVIRSWGGYPDAVAFAVLLMNLAAPTIDYYSQPRVVGQGRSKDG
jgi:electron transport complex protein RnfD